MANATTSVGHDPGFQKIITPSLKHRILTKKEEYALIRRAQRGDGDAMRELGETNLKLILYFANRYRVLGAMMGFTQSDLFNESYEGFHNAVRRFQTHRNLRLSTYAQWWMRHAVVRALEDRGRTIRVPVHTQSAMRRIDRAAREFFAKNGRAPTREEIMKAARISSEKLALAENVPMEPLSYDATVQVRDGESMHLLDAHPDPHAEERTPLDAAATSQSVSRLAEARKRLSKVENAILDYRYRRELTLSETAVKIANLTGGVLSRERIRQLQCEAESKLRKALIASATA
jgi:RNA polymerase primary sigma factor